VGSLIVVVDRVECVRAQQGTDLVVAWIVGTLVNLVAIALAHRFDFPTGYTIVFCNALLALLVTIIPRRAKRG